MLNVASWYGLDVSMLAVHHDTELTLSDVVKKYHGIFTPVSYMNTCIDGDASTCVSI